MSGVIPGLAFYPLGVSGIRWGWVGGVDNSGNANVMFDDDNEVSYVNTSTVDVDAAQAAYQNMQLKISGMKPNESQRNKFAFSPKSRKNIVKSIQPYTLPSSKAPVNEECLALFVSKMNSQTPWMNDDNKYYLEVGETGADGDCLFSSLYVGWQQLKQGTDDPIIIDKGMLNTGIKEMRGDTWIFWDKFIHDHVKNKRAHETQIHLSALSYLDLVMCNPRSPENFELLYDDEQGNKYYLNQTYGKDILINGERRWGQSYDILAFANRNKVPVMVFVASLRDTLQLDIRWFPIDYTVMWHTIVQEYNDTVQNAVIGRGVDTINGLVLKTGREVIESLYDEKVEAEVHHYYTKSPAPICLYQADDHYQIMYVTIHMADILHQIHDYTFEEKDKNVDVESICYSFMQEGMRFQSAKIDPSFSAKFTNPEEYQTNSFFISVLHSFISTDFYQLSAADQLKSVRQLRASAVMWWTRGLQTELSMPPGIHGSIALCNPREFHRDNTYVSELAANSSSPSAFTIESAMDASKSNQMPAKPFMMSAVAVILNIDIIILTYVNAQGKNYLFKGFFVQPQVELYTSDDTLRKKLRMQSTTYKKLHYKSLWKHLEYNRVHCLIKPFNEERYELVKLVGPAARVVTYLSVLTEHLRAIMEHLTPKTYDASQK